MKNISRHSTATPVLCALPVSFLLLCTLILLSPTMTAAEASLPRVVHVYVALCDNLNQGIVPVPGFLGSGEKPETNLYWGAAFGVKTYFKKSKDWKLVKSIPGKDGKVILERCVFKHISRNVFLVADAYRGLKIKNAITDFLGAASGFKQDAVTLKKQKSGPAEIKMQCGGQSDIAVYVGHNAFMDFLFFLDPLIIKKGNKKRAAIILACKSKPYFKSFIRETGAYPLLWTTGLMAPEAYTLKSALDGWIAGESNTSVRHRAAAAYHRYQKCGLNAAKGLLVTGW